MSEKSKFAMGTYFEPDSRWVKLILEIDDRLKDDPRTVDIADLEPLLRIFAAHIKLILCAKHLAFPAIHATTMKMMEAAIEINKLLPDNAGASKEVEEEDGEPEEAGFPDDSELN